MSTLPKFQEPDWSTLPKEAVAWAVDECGRAYYYEQEPRATSTTWTGACGSSCGYFDLTGIDWRTTLRLRPAVESKWTGTKTDTRPQRGGWAPGDYLCNCRACGVGYIGDKRSYSCADCAYSPTVAESATVDHRPEIQALTQSVEGLKAGERNYELERLAEEAWKALIIKLPVIDQTGQLGVKVDDKVQCNRDVADSAFALAEAFIDEREKRRVK